MWKFSFLSSSLLIAHTQLPVWIPQSCVLNVPPLYHMNTDPIRPHISFFQPSQCSWHSLHPSATANDPHVLILSPRSCRYTPSQTENNLWTLERPVCMALRWFVWHMTSSCTICIHAELPWRKNLLWLSQFIYFLMTWVTTLCNDWNWHSNRDKLHKHYILTS